MKSNFTTKTCDDVTIVEKDGVKYAQVRKVHDTRVLKPTLEDLTVSEPATIEKIAQKLEIYGGARVRNYLPIDVCDEIINDVKPYFGVNNAYDGDFIPKETKRVAGTMAKSKTAAEKLLVHPLTTGVGDKFLAQENWFYLGDKLTSGVSTAQLHTCLTFNIGPGAANQVLHRDDMNLHNVQKRREVYEYGQDTSLGTMLALSKTTKANGATRFIPGSHLWDHFRPPKEEETVYAELDKGDAFFMLASCFHGGSANTTLDEYRMQVVMFMTRGTCRQEENLMLETPMKYWKSLSKEAVIRAGLATSNPFLGFYRDLQNPLMDIKPDEVNDKDKDISPEVTLDVLYSD